MQLKIFSRTCNKMRQRKRCKPQFYWRMRVIPKAKNKINNNNAKILQVKFSGIPDQCQEQMDSLRCISTRQNHKKD